MKKMNVAIFSPSINQYSETFIAAHRDFSEHNISFYYFGLIPSALEDSESMAPFSYRLLGKLLSFINNKSNYQINRNLRYSLKKRKIDVVLAEYGPVGEANCKLLEELNIPLVVHFHGYDASRFDVLKKHNNYKGVFQYASKVISVSEVMKEKLLKIGCPSEKLILNTYGPNSIFENVKHKVESSNFIAIGRFVEKKAPYLLILAFKEVIVDFPNATLQIAGDGEFLNVCQNIIDAYDLQNSITLLGIVTPGEYKDRLNNSLAFVQHSVTATSGDMEGTPLAVLEASSAGLPVISTLHAGIPDVIIHNETGLLSEEKDVFQMAENMKKVLLDKEFARKLGENGRNNIKQKFTLTRHIKELDRILSSIV